MSPESGRLRTVTASASAGASSLDLREALAVLRRRKLTIALSVLVVVTLALAYSFSQTKTYEATAEVLLRQRSSAAVFDPSIREPVYPEREIKNELEFARSEVVSEQVQEELGYKPTVQVNTATDTDVIIVNGSHADPAEAARTANVYAETYLDLRRQSQVEDYQQTGTVLQERISELDQQLDQSTSTDERQALLNQRSLYQQRLDSLLFSADIAQAGGAQITNRAQTPTEPASPAPLTNTVAGLIAGLALGVGLAFLRENLDDSVKTKDDLERAAGVTTLAVIPVDPGWKRKEQGRVVLRDDPVSPAAEGYRSLRTSLQFSSLDKPIRVLQVTSPSPGDGKTTAVANLGVALARAGLDVLLVSLDLHRPRLHTFFGLSNTYGFSSLLLGTMTQDQAIQFVPREEGLRVLGAGAPPPNPSELLSFEKTAKVLEDLRASADVVIIDSPPVLPVSDALVISKYVDATLVVATAGGTARRDVHRAVEMLNQVDAPIIGTVLNRAVPGAGGYAVYTYDAEPEPEDDARRSRPGRVDWDEVTASGGLRSVRKAVVPPGSPARPVPFERNGGTGGNGSNGAGDTESSRERSTEL